MRKIPTYILSLIILAGVLFLPNTVRAAAAEVAGTVSTGQGRLYVRKGASTGTAAVSSLAKGSLVTLLSRSGDWWQVQYGKDQVGYCHSAYITPVSGNIAKVHTQSGNLNVRAQAGTTYAKTGSLPKGEQVIVLSDSNGWSRILYHGTKTGYVSSGYLRSAQSYPQIALNVPSFKQMDSRWSNKTIGSSGKTFFQIGCATTAIAMLESYRTGTTVYPDTMSKQLRYTPSGSVYWPSHYTVVTDSAGYLKGLYTLLAQGKPVLLGVHNNAGKQHWVIVTGYTGGDTLTAAGFAVNDPGSSVRRNLQQLLELYPNFYKYFYY